MQVITNDSILVLNGEAYSLQGDTPDFTPAAPLTLNAHPAVSAISGPIGATATTVTNKETVS